MWRVSERNDYPAVRKNVQETTRTKGEKVANLQGRARELERSLHGHRLEVNRERGTGKRSREYYAELITQGHCSDWIEDRENSWRRGGKRDSVAIDRGTHTISPALPYPFSFLTSRLLLSPSSSQQYESRVRLMENHKHRITRPVCLGCLHSNPSTHRRKSTCSDVRWLRLGFSTSVRYPDARVLPYPKHNKFPSW